MADVTLADAKAHLSELVNQVEAGGAVRITRRGKPVAQLTAVTARPAPINAAELRALTDAQLRQTETAEDTVRTLRDEDRY